MIIIAPKRIHTYNNIRVKIEFVSFSLHGDNDKDRDDDVSDVANLILIHLQVSLVLSMMISTFQTNSLFLYFVYLLAKLTSPIFLAYIYTSFAAINYKLTRTRE